LKIKVLILTSSLNGTAAHHLPFLLASEAIDIVMVIYNDGAANNAKSKYRLKLKKLIKIGIFGALNGIKMRKWYQEDLNKYLSIRNLEKICLENNIQFNRTHAINCAQTKQWMTEAKADIGISLGNGYIAKSVFCIPKHGMINIHHELLPAYQNAQSVIWQIYNGSKETGYTIHKIDRHIDTGEILFQEKVPILFNETLAVTVTSTYASVLEHSAKGLVKVLASFDLYFKNAYSQGIGHSYTTPTLNQYKKIKQQFYRLKNNF
jgi:methionyl-tRNA formyltransferase